MEARIEISRTQSGRLPAALVMWSISTCEAFQRSKTYDLVAALPLITWFVFCILVQAPVLAAQIYETNFETADATLLATFASKMATLVFIGLFALLLALRHKPRTKMKGFYPRFAAIAGTYLGVGILLLQPRELSVPILLLSTMLVIIGTVLSIYALFFLGRSLSLLPEARRLITDGPYSLVRHPLYLAEAIGLLGLVLQYLSPLALALAVLQCVFQVQRMKNEERVLLDTFPEYGAYIANTARLLPGVY